LSGWPASQAVAVRPNEWRPTQTQPRLITNTQGQKTTGTHRISLFPELEKFFHVIIVAGENEIPPKPDAEPFRLCLKKLNIEADQAVYVGDDYRIDICGALDAGLHPVWLKHSSVQRNWPEVQASVPVISSLKQLLDLDDIFPDDKVY